MNAVTIEVVVIAGSPGSGKSTLMNALGPALGDPPRIEFGHFREWHLDPMWKRQSPKEESMAFENLVFVIDNYRRHEMTPVLVTDLREHRVQDLADRYGSAAVIVTLVAPDDEIRRRISARAEGFIDVDAATAWNKRVTRAEVLPTEVRYDSGLMTAEDIVSKVVAVISTR